MYVHCSNRTERLLDALEALVREPSGDPFTPECIAVQGRGMERWLSMELARRLGVWANPDFPFPRRLIERILGAAPAARRVDAAPFDPERLVWSIRALFTELAQRPELAPIRRYVEGDERGVRALQLAGRIAETFDHYAVHRPDTVLDWERGGGAAGDWQPLLWRALVERHGSTHVAARARTFLDAAAAGKLDASRLPRRISLFGISSLPPLYVEVLAALGARAEVHLFVLSPSREYWAQIRSERQILRSLTRQDTDPEDAEERLHYEVGHPLLASLGRLGRDFQGVLESAEYREGEADLYVDPGCSDALHTLQSDILGLRQRGGRDQPERLVLRPDDASIRIHSCHGPMREVEVLHDQLLALFAEIPDLAPHEVVVMTPSIDAYAPAIEAVFGTASEGAIPYRISDRGPRAAAEIVDAFERLLDLLGGRMKAPEVLDLLGIAAVRERFGIAASDLEILREWVREAGIRWAVDAGHRAETGQPELAQNTWRAGLDRLLLGYALDDAEALVGGCLPYTEIEGTSAKLLGAFVELLELLFAMRERLAAPRPVTDWCADLRGLIAAAIADDPTTADQVQELAGALDDLAERAAAARFAEPITLAALRISLGSELRRRISTHGFLARGVCFCELVPMRTIPFRVVCLIGMSDGSFPRSQRPLGFDLMAQQPRPGDRSAREDDRYLFLEALLAARERLLVTYVGQSIRDNAVHPPSVVVSELLDALDETFCMEPGQAAETERATAVRRHLETAHPLQPFSPRYFEPALATRLFSFRADQRDAAAALLGERRARPPFLSAPLALHAPVEVALDDLVALLSRPTRWFARNQLGLRMGRDARPVESREPIAIDALEGWSIGSRTLEGLLRGASPAEMRERLVAAGALPPGALGERTFDLLLPDVRGSFAAARRYRTSARPALEIDLHLAGVRVLGRIDAVWAEGPVWVHFSRMRGRQDLAAWIRHVFLCAARPGDAIVSTVVGRARAGTDVSAIRFLPVAGARELAAGLIELERGGRVAPLPFFASASRAYAEVFSESRSATRAYAAARKQSDFPQSTGWLDYEEPEVALLFRARDPDEAVAVTSDGRPLSFSRVALDVFAPLLAHERDA